MNTSSYTEHLSIRHPDAFYIAGEWRRAVGKERLDVVYPGHGRSIARPPEVTTAEIDLAVAAARNAFDKGPWPRLSARERGDMLTKLAAEIRKRGAEVGRAWIVETGTTAMIAGQSGFGNADMVDYFAGLAQNEPFHEIRARGDGKVGIVMRAPAGVVAAILPWNCPFGLALLTIAPALAAGCCIIYKPAPETPLHSWILAECFEAAGFPAGVFNMVPARAPVADHLVRHAGVDVVALTGSAAAGRHIASVCGSRLARVHLELGGKSPAIILADADPTAVVPNLVPHFTMNCGQMCAALTRIIVPRRRREEYAEAIGAALRALPVGDPFDPAAFVGPLAMQRQHKRVFEYIERGKSEGARLVTGGGRPKGFDTGFYVEPTLFTDVTNDMVIAREEIFGPVGALLSYDTEAEAIEIANDTIYGLNAAVFSQDLPRAAAVMRQIRAGNVTHNGWVFDHRFPFGGFKQSGIGRNGGLESVYSYTEYQTLYLDQAPANFAS